MGIPNLSLVAQVQGNPFIRLSSEGMTLWQPSTSDT